MKRSIMVGGLVLLLAGGVACWMLPPARLASQYHAPQFTCACDHSMVLAFVGGSVRLHNLGHGKFYEFGSYKTNGDRLVWLVPSHATEFTMKPERFGMTVENQAGGGFRFSRVSRAFDTSGHKESEKGMNEYVKDLTRHFDKKPVTAP